MIAGLAYLDVALLAILAISGMVAMYRGFTRELLSIVSWGAAAGAVVYFIRYHRPFAEEVARHFSNPVQTSYIYVAQVAIGGLIFLVVLVIVHLITSRISDTVLDSRVGAIDRILGLAFGVLRGFVLVVIPYHVLRVVRARPPAAGALGAQRHLASLHQVHRRFVPRHPGAAGSAPADGPRGPAAERAFAACSWSFGHAQWSGASVLPYIQGAPRTRMPEPGRRPGVVLLDLHLGDAHERRASPA